jgi:hypothetical protein
VTSRPALALLPGAHRLLLDVLDAGSCERMLAAILGADRVSAEREQRPNGFVPWATSSKPPMPSSEPHSSTTNAANWTAAENGGLALFRAYAGSALGDHLVTQGRYAEARALFEMGLDVMRTAGVHAGEASFLRRLARVTAKDGQFDTALALASRAVSMTEATGGGLYAHSLWALGDVHSARGDETAARVAWQQSRKLFDHMGSKEGPEV